MIATDFQNLQNDTAVIILAAGSSSRLGKPKQLLEYQQETLIKHAVKTALLISKTVIVVTGFLHEEIIEELKTLELQIVHNPDWQEGMGSSIQTGIKYLQQLKSVKQINSAMILLSDQPLISAEHLQKLRSQFYLDKRSIAATGYAETEGVPAVFHKKLFPVLQNLPGNRGAQWLFKKYPDQLTIVPFEGAAIDVDTKEDYLRLLQLVENQPE
ncbi:MAG: nucleotidyltransferase family protein [Sphingobacteriaceae bacterium]|nr:MAG: nucleotidyltransferase family protein [Sphingobacteriaceae bacterium]